MDKYEVACCDEDVVACFEEGVLELLNKNNKDDLIEIFSIHTPWNKFLRKPWVGNVYSTMVICRKLADVIPMTTSVITITIKSR